MGFFTKTKKYWKPQEIREKLRKISSLDWKERKVIERNLEGSGDLVSKKELRNVLRGLRQKKILEKRDKGKLKKTFGLTWWR